MEWHTLTLPRSLTNRASLHKADETRSDIAPKSQGADPCSSKAPARDASSGNLNGREGPPGNEAANGVNRPPVTKDF